MSDAAGTLKLHTAMDVAIIAVEMNLNICGSLVSWVKVIRLMPAGLSVGFPDLDRWRTPHRLFPPDSFPA
jgi:hypothetical protein